MLPTIQLPLTFSASPREFRFPTELAHAKTRRAHRGLKKAETAGKGFIFMP